MSNPVRFAPALVGMALAALAGPALASEPLHSLVVPAGDFALQVARKEGAKSVRVELPVGPKPPLPGAAPEDFRRLLSEYLHDNGVNACSRAALGVWVDYRHTQPDETGHGLSLLTLKVVVVKEGASPDKAPCKVLRLTSESKPHKELLKSLAQVDDPVDQLALPELARKVAARLRGMKQNSVCVKPFDGPSNAGVGYAKRLRECLGPWKVAHDPTAQTQLQGSFAIDDKSAPMRITFNAQLTRARNGTALATITAAAQLPGGRQQADYFVATGETTEAAGAPRPPAAPRSSVARPGNFRDVGIEVVVKGKPVLLEPRDTPLVYLKPDDVYTLRLSNNTSREVAVRLFIDGFSLFEFETSRVKPRAIIIPPKSSFEVPGWYRHNALASQFCVSRYDPSSDLRALTAPGKAGQVGTITAIFHYSWKKSEPAPADEQTKDVPLETRIGQGHKQKVVVVPRIIGKKLRGCVTVRYAAR